MASFNDYLTADGQKILALMTKGVGNHFYVYAVLKQLTGKGSSKCVGARLIRISDSGGKTVVF